MFCFVSIKFHFQPVVIIWLLRFASVYYKDSLTEGKSFLFCQIKGNFFKTFFWTCYLIWGVLSQFTIYLGIYLGFINTYTSKRSREYEYPCTIQYMLAVPAQILK